VFTADYPAYMRWDTLSVVDPYARLIGLGSPRQMNADLFEDDASYSTLTSDSKQRSADKDPPANPLARPVRRRWSIGYIEFYPPVDFSSPPKAFVVSTGEPIRGGIPVKIPYLIKHYVRNEAWFNESAALEMAWSMDSSKKILCTKFEGSEEFEDKGTGVKFVEVAYELWCLGSLELFTWDEKRLDAGSYWVDYDEGHDIYWPCYLEDKHGTKSYADGAIPLDGDGGKLSQEDIDAGNFHWNTFVVNRTVDFSSLGLPGI
jgi:hypothetical protein